jgi:hypothetical protein
MNIRAELSALHDFHVLDEITLAQLPPGISKGIKARESRRMNIDDGFVGRFRIREQVLSTIIALLAPLETY